jgi:hypothetical protein
MIIILSLLLSSVTFVRAEPIYPAYVFYFTNLGIGGTETIYKDLTAMGYTAFLEKDWNAKQILEIMDQCAVFVYVGHGSPGILSCTGTQQISALTVPDNDMFYSLQAQFSNTETKLSKVRLVYYGSCFSDSDSQTYGRLTTYTANSLRATAVIGFSGSVSNQVASHFEAVLFDRLLAGYDVQTAVHLAKADAQAHFQDKYATSNVDTAAVYGNGNVVINPAAFGIR